MIANSVGNFCAEDTAFGLGAAGAGALLITGLWTTVAALLLILLASLELLGHRESLCPDLLMFAMGAALGLIGPGALSLDARFFGLNFAFPRL
jgi:hypothetical protein